MTKNNLPAMSRGAHIAACCQTMRDLRAEIERLGEDNRALAEANVKLIECAKTLAQDKHNLENALAQERERTSNVTQNWKERLRKQVELVAQRDRHVSDLRAKCTHWRTKAEELQHQLRDAEEAVDALTNK